MRLLVALVSVTLFAVAPAYAQDAIPLDCNQNAQGLGGAVGTSFVANCPAGCTSGTIWGTAIYSDDSAVCTAAVHAGAVSADDGGMVLVVIQPGQAGYAPTTQNAVTSSAWGEWNRSFSVAAYAPAEQITADCTTTASGIPGEAGATYSVTCPEGCTSSPIWGTGIYSDDSAICTAAIHAGTIPATGGTFTLTIAPGQPGYVAGTQNGVTSAAWAEWGRSFTTAPTAQ